MVRTASTMLALGSTLPAFKLPNVDGRIVSSDEFSDSAGLLVIFMCNHCPFVIHVRQELAKFAKEYTARGLAIVGISSNDVTTYPQDGPELMKVEHASAGYVFPYLYDESQVVAKAFQAACTPDFFLFDQSGKLVYRGQFDDTRPKSGQIPNGKDLRMACDALLSGKPIELNQTPSIGCNIKWKAGSEPAYFAQQTGV